MQELQFDSIEEVQTLVEELTKIADKHYGYDIEEYALEDTKRGWEIAIENALDGKEVEEYDDPCELLDNIGHPFCVNDGLPDESMRFDEWDEDYWGIKLTYGFYFDCDQYATVTHSIPILEFRGIGLDVMSDYIQQRTN